MLKNILYILLLERLHFHRSGDPPHHPLHSWIFSFGDSSGNGTKIVQPINISEWIQGRIRNSFSGEIFRHSVTHQATNSWQEQFQIQSPEIHRAHSLCYRRKTWQGTDFQMRYSKWQGNKKLQHNCFCLFFLKIGSLNCTLGFQCPYLFFLK